MKVEIERKFLVKNQDWKKLIVEKHSIQQGYLNTDKSCNVRVRIMNNLAFITIKGKRIHTARPEFEYEIPLNDAESILKLSKTSIIKKTRYTVNHKGQIWEIDQFEGDNQGLVIAEIELKQKDEAISLPNWIGIEISNDERFYNLSLSINPFKNWN
ncbi:CYTH domain-containing protein [Chitinophagales bacterium]|nr:CYTH domain-containing protein [Chitinophagales bacterium]